MMRAKTMIHMTHNYQLGLIVLVFGFLIFYTPLFYAFMVIRKQKRRHKIDGDSV